VEAGRGIALSTSIFKLVTGKRLLYRSVTGTTESVSLGLVRATNGEVAPAGVKICEILRKTFIDRVHDRKGTKSPVEGDSQTLPVRMAWDRLKRGVSY